jgi:hypothetical protein
VDDAVFVGVLKCGADIAGDFESVAGIEAGRIPLLRRERVGRGLAGRLGYFTFTPLPASPLRGEEF